MPDSLQPAIIRRLKTGRNDESEFRQIVMGAAKNSIPDYQLSAWLTAAYLRELDTEETVWLTREMAASGDRLDLTGLPKPWIDKHSTGGVGDKTSIVLMPLLAACGVTMVKMSGRGLGITGGTVDKLESVPGFRINLSPQEMVEQARRIGIAWTGQTPNLAPADKTLYALRDATGTVDSIPLIVSSILSKKVAGGADIVMIDVKCGSGAFMQHIEGARALAHQLVNTGREVALPTHCTITDMSQPLGRCVGNALEIVEAVQVLKGAPGRFTDLCVAIAAETLVPAGLARTEQEAEQAVLSALAEGKALAKAREWFEAQGATVDVFDDSSWVPRAPVIIDCCYRGDAGFVSRVDAGTVGEAVVALGGGRRQKSDQIDPSVGVESLKTVGDAVSAGEAVFRVHARSEAEAHNACAELLKGFVVSSLPVPELPLILERIG
jgi:pyrimidine-nucleoside phosphorylase